MATDQDIRDVERHGLSALLDWAFGSDANASESELEETDSSSPSPRSTEVPS